MPTDVLTLSALAQELDSQLSGARIDKIYQPEEDEVTFLVRKDSENKLLVISANPSIPRLYLSKQKKDNPLTAPNFCMLLRKHLTSARIQKVELFGFDRIIKFTCIAKNEMMDEVTVYLYFEYMGRYSNLIITNENGKIFDVLRRVSLDTSRTRKLLPSFTYIPPVSDKINIFDTDKLKKVVEYSNGDVDALLKNCMGLSRESATELFSRAKTHPSIADGFITSLDALILKPCPTIALNDSGMPVDFFVDSYHTLPYAYEKAPTLSEAMERCFTSKDTSARIKAKTKHFLTVVKNAISRCEKKLGVNRQKLLDCEKADVDRIKGELLNANLYKIERGMTSIVLDNYYNGETITVTLDATKTPAQNAQNYFRRYTKLKRTKETVEKMIEENVNTLTHLKALLYDVTSASIESDVTDVEQVLVDAGLIVKKQSKLKAQTKQSKPYKYVFDGVDIYVGRNNLQNDVLTFKNAQKSDTWLHVKGYHGSHVIIKSSNVTDSVLTFAGELASYYSEARGSSKVEVDYTLIKNVKRAPSKKLGLAVYENYSTIVVTPLSHEKFQVE